MAVSDTELSVPIKNEMLPVLNHHLLIRYYYEMFLMVIICIPIMIRWVDFSTEFWVCHSQDLDLLLHGLVGVGLLPRLAGFKLLGYNGWLVINLHRIQIYIDIYMYVYRYKYIHVYTSTSTYSYAFTYTYAYIYINGIYLINNMWSESIFMSCCPGTSPWMPNAKSIAENA